MPAPLDLTDRRFGHLVVMDEAGRAQQYAGCRQWRCRCDCGREEIVPQTRLTRGYDRCEQCRRVPCEVCGVRMDPARGPKVCPACRPVRRAQQAHASYLRNAAQVKRRSAERAKRERAAGNPACREQDRRKWARTKADPARAEAARRKARDWWAANRERVLARRAARREPIPDRTCPTCQQVYTPTRRDSVYCSRQCRESSASPAQIRACVVCGQEFAAIHPTRLTCSDECRTERKRQQKVDRDRERYLAGLSGAARRLAERQETSVDRRVPCRCCGTPFLAGRRRRPYCSRACRELHRSESTATRRCVVCGQEFAGQKRTDRTCSEECRAERKRQRARDRLAGAESAGDAERACDRCGQRFRGHEQARYCSSDCLLATRSSRDRTRADRDQYHCRVCGRSMADLDLKTHRYTCSDECRAEARRQNRRRAYLSRKGRT